MTARLLVTGGAGFIGSNFARVALRSGATDVRILDKLTYAGHRETMTDILADERASFVEGDIADPGLLRGLLTDWRPDAIVNFAAESHVDRSIDGPRAFIDTNIRGVFELLEATRAYLASADAAVLDRFRFLQVSTDEVYGSLGSTGAFREDDAYVPTSPYAASKASADHLVRAWQKTFETPAIITNCSNNYGPFQFPEKLIPLMILNALEGKPLPIYGDGLNVRDWIYVEDHCEGVYDVLQRGRVGESYNIGADDERTNIEIVDGVCAALDRALPVAENPRVSVSGMSSYAELKTFVEDRPGHDRRYAIDAAKIRAELGWSPKHDLATGLDRTVRWFLDNADWCEAVQGGTDARQRLGLGTPADPTGSTE